MARSSLVLIFTSTVDEIMFIISNLEFLYSRLDRIICCNSTRKPLPCFVLLMLSVSRHAVFCLFTLDFVFPNMTLYQSSVFKT